MDLGISRIPQMARVHCCCCFWSTLIGLPDSRSNLIGQLKNERYWFYRCCREVTGDYRNPIFLFKWKEKLMQFYFFSRFWVNINFLNSNCKKIILTLLGFKSFPPMSRSSFHNLYRRLKPTPFLRLIAAHNVRITSMSPIATSMKKKTIVMEFFLQVNKL